jgi:L-ascorbate metabolism protein UlaG (beta-lactamase superfamily)
MTSSSFKSKIEITHIGTATAILSIDGINFLTDPFFTPAGNKWQKEEQAVTVENTESPAMTLADLPVIDAVLLSHEDHPDNLDELGRRLLDGRRVFTTPDGANNLRPRPAVHGLRPWETIRSTIGGTAFSITGVPCVHVPGGECTGFLLTTASFGETNGRPNAVYFSGDTVYFEELLRMKDMFHISVALYNLGAAMGPVGPGGSMLQITMGGEQGARLFKETGADVLVPMHYMSWKHFTQFDEGLKREFEQAGVLDKVCWLEPGVVKRIV